jgi:hypothetical protein
MLVLVFSRLRHRVAWWVSTFRRNIPRLSSGFIFRTLKMESDCSSKTLAPTWQTTRCCKPEGHNINLHRQENHKSCGDVRNNVINKKFWEELIAYFPWYNTGHIENDASKNSSIVCVFVTAVTFVPSRCLATIHTEPHDLISLLCFSK